MKVMKKKRLQQCSRTLLISPKSPPSSAFASAHRPWPAFPSAVSRGTSPSSASSPEHSLPPIYSSHGVRCWEVGLDDRFGHPRCASGRRFGVGSAGARSFTLSFKPAPAEVLSESSADITDTSTVPQMNQRSNAPARILSAMIIRNLFLTIIRGKLRT